MLIVALLLQGCTVIQGNCERDVRVTTRCEADSGAIVILPVN